MRRHPVLATATAAAVGVIAAPFVLAVLRSPRASSRVAQRLLARLVPRTGLMDALSLVGRLREEVVD